MDQTKDDTELGREILDWLRKMPALDAFGQMLVSIVVGSNAANGREPTKENMQAISDWARMMCQNCEMLQLFMRGFLIADAGEDGVMEAELSPTGQAALEQAQSGKKETEESENAS
jgi:hypothetical protein